MFGLLALAGLIHVSGLGIVVTHGISMAPRFATGDLAVTRASPDYRAGDVVAYRSATLNTVVLHRITRAEGNRFVTQGDNNSWIDPDSPSSAEIQGRLLMRIPRVGRLVEVARHPAGVLIGGLLLFGGPALLRRRHPRKRSLVADRPATSTRRVAPATTFTAGATAAAVIGLGLLAASAVWLAPQPDAGQVAPAAEPAGRTDSTSADTERLAVGYQARTSAVATYPEGVLRTGDPIFVKAVRTLSVTATYTGERSVPVMLTTELTHPSGWHRAGPLGPVATARSAGTATAAATLDLRAVTALIHGFSAETGLPAPGAVMALVAKAGAWTKRLELTFDGMQFRAVEKNFAESRAIPRAAAGAPDTTTQPAGAPRFRHFLAPVGRLLPTASLRTGVTVGVILLIASALLALWRQPRSTGTDLPARRIGPAVAHAAASRSRTTVHGPHGYMRRPGTARSRYRIRRATSARPASGRR